MNQSNTGLPWSKRIFDIWRFANYIHKDSEKANSFKRDLPSANDGVIKHYIVEKLPSTASKLIFKVQMVYAFNDERKIL